jgi:hypothetical protein
MRLLREALCQHQGESAILLPQVLRRCPSEGGEEMSEELYTKVAAYRQAMSLAKAMLVRGIITEKEYGEIDTMMAQRYDLSFGTIFR